MEKKKIVQFLRNQLTELEKLEVLDWIESSSANQDIFNEIKNIWVLTDTFGKEPKVKHSEPKFMADKTRRSIKMVDLIKYAAISLIAIAIGALFYIQGHKLHQVSQQVNEYIVPNGQTSNILLSDGSRVYLNSGSILKYSGSYAIKERVLYLEGEAFFDVVSNKKKPFIVKTALFDVRATGTSFNVQAYTNSDISDITLVSGSLSVVSQLAHKPLQLTSGEKASLNRKTDKFKLSMAGNSQYISWKEGIITFRNARLEDIAKMLERTYNVTISFTDEKTKDLLYSGSMLRYKPIDQVLELLELTSDISYNIETKANEPNLITIK
jgi:ferric-dicitrate binding protein FerR (iron transport regulator)